jgi:uncharacterized protein YggU (UPF0235/DUF167 family)
LPGFFEYDGKSVKLRVRLTPNARSDLIGGIHLDSSGQAWLKASVRAVPEKGRANAALVELLARQTGIARSRFELSTGHTGRTKSFRIGVASQSEVAALSALAGD